MCEKLKIVGQILKYWKCDQNINNCPPDMQAICTDKRCTILTINDHTISTAGIDMVEKYDNKFGLKITPVSKLRENLNLSE